MTDISTLIDRWEQSGTNLASLFDELSPPDWEQPTALPGWSVRDIGAHAISIERTVNGIAPRAKLDPVPPHVTNDFQRFTEIGVRSLDGELTSSFAGELRRWVSQGAAAVRADPPADLKSSCTNPIGAATGWTWAQFLGNRALDNWFHEQDIRAAVNRPGGTDGPVAAAVLAHIRGALGYVAGRQAQLPPGRAVRVEVTGPAGFATTVAVDEAGRGGPAEHLEPEATVRMDPAAMVRLYGGRGPVEDVPVTISGDRALAEQLLRHMAATP